MKEALVCKVVEIVEPIVTNLGYELYHVEFVKEGGEDYLRIYIDNEEGIKLDDCVKVNKAVGEILDIEDPIPDFYYLEISSPGMERELHTDKHLQRYIDYSVSIKLKSLINGKKKLEGTLKSFDSLNLVILNEEGEIVVPREKVLIIKLKGEF
ncbi:ribosome maturation factor RimP [Clostridium collagenovorans DSM 3089]|uniref:Ribosome maturation factor RimP n=1 Tax=Clostridium collagenovorans DSM 3089 TaxID=1121306 RepID=A0A1M5SWM3_9CLOT|nr:ribosome maturation factor RimP [Clostridium collagenovorans]SHH42648.1 ribosome maturation factor RimP [Clostridium collagenovorans DSM 3089]